MTGWAFCPYFPTLSRTHWTARPDPAARPFPFGADGTSYWFRGRVAIWQGIHALGLKPGDRVLVPAYACGSEIEPLLQAGLSLLFYRADSQLRPDIEQLERLCQEPCRALWVTHYFGFAQPLDKLHEFARKHALFLVEDTTHGLFSRAQDGRPLGSRGDMSVFSFGKTLAVPNGAMLHLAAGAAAARPAAARNPSAYALMGWTRSLLEAELTSRYPAAGAWMEKYLTRPIAQAVKRRVKESSVTTPKRSDAVPHEMSVPSAWRNWSTSPISRTLLARADHRWIVERRRENYRILLDGLSTSPGARPLFERLPDGCCPLAFPLRASEPKALVDQLRSHGVASLRFWPTAHPAIPEMGFPLETDLRRHLVSIPIHQGIGREDAQRIAGLVKDWSGRA
jgi:dTDP-4-amino-4,6-dideoxygalactose transaminase